MLISQVYYRGVKLLLMLKIKENINSIQKTFYQLCDNLF